MGFLTSPLQGDSEAHLGHAMFKSDGTPIRDPRKYVEKLGGNYKGDLYDEIGKPIDDPVAFVEFLSSGGKAASDAGSAPRRRAASDAGSAGTEGELYKADGTPVRDPVAYVQAFERRGGEYDGGLFDCDGNEIEDPIEFVRGMERRPRPPPARSAPYARSAPSNTPLQSPRSSSFGGSTSPAGVKELYKADGTVVRDPVRYVQAFEKTGGYKGGLFTASGAEIKNPAAYVAGFGTSTRGASSDLGRGPPSRPSLSMQAPFRSPPPSINGGSEQGDVELFKADGTPVRDPVAYVAAFERTGGYKGGLFTAEGREVRDPIAFVNGAGRRGSVQSTPPGLSRSSSPAGSVRSFGGSSAAGASGVLLYKEDGTLVKNPERYIAAFEHTGGYKGGLFNERGQEIKDPIGYLNARNASAGGARSSTGPMLAGSSGGPFGRQQEHGGSSGVLLYKEDGTVVKNPERYIAAFEHTGGYKGGLFNEKGEEIKDPVGYLNARNASSGGARNRPPPSLVGSSGGPKLDDTLYKADGTPVRDPVAYVRAFERKGGGYQGGLFNSKGAEIRDPLKYISNMSGYGKALPERSSGRRGDPY